MKYRLGFFVLSCFFVFGLQGCDFVSSIKEYFSKSKQTAQPASSQTENISKPLPANVLARVGSWTITQEEFQDRLDALKEVVPDYDTENKDARKLVLDELIRQQLLVIDAESSGLANQKDINAAVEEFRRTLIVREVARKLTENINVPTSEALAFYNDNKQQLIQPMELRVREIAVETQEKANEVLIEILKGADFGSMAQQYSISASAQKGGDLGFIDNVPFPQMLTPLISLEEGDVSSVFKGPNGFYIVKLEEKKGGEQIPFEDVESEIIQNRKAYKQQQAILNHIKELEQKIPVEINDSLL